MSMQPSDFGGESRRTREVLRQSEERFRLLVEGVRDYAIFMLDPYGYITTWNQGAQRIKGYDSEEIIGEHFSIFYTDEDVERGHPEEELRIAKAEGSYEEEGLRVRKDGSTFWASVLITALRDKDGELRGFAKVTRDITARKEAEERERLLAQERAALERTTDILESISDAFFAVDRQWRFTYVNREAERLWDRPREGLLGKNLWEEFPEEVDSESYRQIRRAMEEGKTTEFESLSPVSGARVAGRAYPSREGPSVYFRDVTERKRAEEALRRVREAERKRIARDLHDGPLQDFSYTAAALGMGAAAGGHRRGQARRPGTARGGQRPAHRRRRGPAAHRDGPVRGEAESDHGPRHGGKPRGGRGRSLGAARRDRNAGLARDPGGAYQRPQARRGEEDLGERAGGGG